ncbi:MAG: hypothetical protein INR64_09505 [Caulobacteraceae bacterium]|nr:hypothetical protein [Caulobacter sp.]
MSERSARSLLALQNSASTARVLNLHKVWRTHGQGGRVAPPMFAHPMLDRCLVIKHRLRPNEIDLFKGGARTSATKIVIPIDSHDLKLGGHSIFVGQQGYVAALEQAFGSGFDKTEDFFTLAVLDRLPSLDPFLLREQLRRHGRTPHQCYFEMSTADIERMFAFVRREVEQLVTLSFGAVGATEGQLSRLTQKILADTHDTEMEPLRETLRLAPEEYREGMFCWRGFLYYKWSLNDLRPHIAPVMDQIGKLSPFGKLDESAQGALVHARANVRRSVQRALAVISGALGVYDDAYAKLTREGRPTAFREFLLDAPELFTSLGERLGAVSHVTSFWRYQYPGGLRSRVGLEELMDVLYDFEGSLGFPDVAFDAAKAA